MKKRSRILRTIQKALFQRLGLKVFSFVAAVVLFSLVSGSEDAQRSVFVEVISLLPPASTDKILVSDLPDKVKITLRGSRSLVNTLDGTNFGPIQIDLRDVRTRYYYFDASAFEIPGGIEVVQIVPASVPLRWEKKVKKKVPVMVRFVGNTDPGTSLRKPSVPRPAEVGVEGPEQEIRALKLIQTEALPIDELGVGEYDREVHLEPLAPRSSYLGSNTVSVKFEIYAEKIEKELKDLQVELPKKLPPGSTLAPDKVSVTLRGSSSLLQSLNKNTVIPFIETPRGILIKRLRRDRLVSVQLRGIPKEGVEVEIKPPSLALSVTPSGRNTGVRNTKTGKNRRSKK